MMGFGFVAVAVLILSLVAWRVEPSRYASAAGVSLMLLFTWWSSNALIGLYGVPDGVRAYPVIDLIGLSIMALCWSMRPKVWKFAVMILFAAMLAAHWSFWSRPGSLAFTTYAGILDALFAGQLIATAFPGAGHVADRALLLLSDRRGPDHGLGAR